jgi:hypothetical protein
LIVIIWNDAAVLMLREREDLQSNPAISPMNTQLTSTEKDETCIDQGGNIACPSNCYSILWVFHRAHECLPVVSCRKCKEKREREKKCV